MAGLGIEDENRAIDRLSCQVSFKCLVNGDSVDVCVVDEPNNLIGEELGVVLRIEVRLCRLARVKLQTLSDTLS